MVDEIQYPLFVLMSYEKELTNGRSYPQLLAYTAAYVAGASDDLPIDDLTMLRHDDAESLPAVVWTIGKADDHFWALVHEAAEANKLAD